jgi:hypothetical protein
MAKDTFYFSHDYNARNDIKIKRLLSKFGYEGYGIFWALIEDLYNNTNVLRLDYETISFDLRCNIEMVKSIINDFDLFVIEGDIFGSSSIHERLESRNAKSEKARESVLKRWERVKNNTNVLQTQNESNTNNLKRNTIKESIVNENKVKKIHKESIEIVFPFVSENFKKMWNNWILFKKQQHNFTYKSSMSEQGALKDLSKISDGNEQMAIDLIENAISKGWKGIYKPDNFKGNGTGGKQATSISDEFDRQFFGNR